MYEAHVPLGGIFRLIRILLTPAGFIGTGFFITFVGLVWITEPSDRPPPEPAPVLPALSELEKFEGVISDVSLPDDYSTHKVIAVDVRRGSDGSVVGFKVPDAVLDKVGYLELKGKPIALAVDSQRTVYDVRSGERILYSYEDSIVRHQAAVSRYEEKIKWANATSRTGWGIAFTLLGPALFVGGIMRWRRRGRPD